MQFSASTDARKLVIEEDCTLVAAFYSSDRNSTTTDVGISHSTVSENALISKDPNSGSADIAGTQDLIQLNHLSLVRGMQPPVQLGKGESVFITVTTAGLILLYLELPS